MSRWIGPVLGLILLGIVGIVAIGIMIVTLVLPTTATTANNVSTQALRAATQSVDTPTPVPTFTPTAAPTVKPTMADTVIPTPTDTPAPTDTPVPPTATNTPQRPAATPTRRPPTATAPPPPPAGPPTPQFIVIEQRMHSLNENGGCYGRHNYFITVVDKNNRPLDGIIIRGKYSSTVIPYTGKEKGSGKTEMETPRYSGDQLYVYGHIDGTRYNSEFTRNLSVSEAEIPIEDLIKGGYCPNPTECQRLIKDNQLCLGHHSYSVTFQRQW